jgi:hypothetical protein
MLPAGHSITSFNSSATVTVLTTTDSTGNLIYYPYSGSFGSYHTSEELKEQACNILRQTLTNNPEYLSDLYKVLDEFSIKNDVRAAIEE